jgi:hypothetical protein
MSTPTSDSAAVGSSYSGAAAGSSSSGTSNLLLNHLVVLEFLKLQTSPLMSVSCRVSFGDVNIEIVDDAEKA